MNAFVLIDNKDGSVIGVFPKEKHAKGMLRIMGNERIGDEFARFAYEKWSWVEVNKWIEDPSHMGLGQTPIIIKDMT